MNPNMNSWPNCRVMLPMVTPKKTASRAVETTEKVPTVQDRVTEVYEPTASISKASNALSGFPKFTIFPRFPQEIRLNIWRATFEAQKVVIRVESDGWISPSSGSRRPVSLYVCSESRDETVKCYRLLFAKSRYPTYFNPLIDIPHIRHGSKGNRRVRPDPSSPLCNFSSVFLSIFRLAFDANFLSSLRQLAIDRDLWVLRMGSATKVMSLFGKLRDLYVVIDDTFLQDEDEWVDTDDPDEDRRDVILFMTALSSERKPPDGYHKAEEKFFYILRRMKLRTSDKDISHFTEPQKSSGYASYVKEEVLASLNDGSGDGSPRRGPDVKVVVEDFDGEPQKDTATLQGSNLGR